MPERPWPPVSSMRWCCAKRETSCTKSVYNQDCVTDGLDRPSGTPTEVPLLRSTSSLLSPNHSIYNLRLSHLRLTLSLTPSLTPGREKKKQDGLNTAKLRVNQFGVRKRSRTQRQSNQRLAEPNDCTQPSDSPSVRPAHRSANVMGPFPEGGAAGFCAPLPASSRPSWPSLARCLWSSTLSASHRLLLLSCGSGYFAWLASIDGLGVGD
jgi:hypothetical protein